MDPLRESERRAAEAMVRSVYTAQGLTEPTYGFCALHGREYVYNPWPTRSECIECRAVRARQAEQFRRSQEPLHGMAVQVPVGVLLPVAILAAAGAVFVLNSFWVLWGPK